MEVPKPTYTRVVTEAPLDDLWSYYRRFEVMQGLRNLVPGGWPEANAEAVRHCVRQAREYFRSARAAPLLTRPVLLYYGQISLAKLLLLLDPTAPSSMEEVEAIERSGHGLRQHDPDPGAGDGYDLEEGHVEVASEQAKGGGLRPRGLFPHLARVVCPPSASLWLGERLRIKDLLRAVPQLDLVMRQAFGEGEGFTGIPVAHYVHPVGNSLYPDGRTELMVWKDASGPKTLEEAQKRVIYLDSSRYQFTPRDRERHPFGMTVDPGDLYALPVREELSPHLYGHCHGK